MSGSNRDPRLLPQVGDVIKTANGNQYRVVGRGVAASVRFVRLKGAHSLHGQKSINCWRRLAQGATVITVN